MTAQINIQYGETVERRFVFEGGVFDIARDKLLFVVRDATEAVLYAKTLSMVFDDTTFADLLITHSDSELKLLPGAHRYGLSIYKNAVIADGYPVDGIVVIPIGSAPFVVVQSESREEGVAGHLSLNSLLKSSYQPLTAPIYTHALLEETVQKEAARW